MCLLVLSVMQVMDNLGDKGLLTVEFSLKVKCLQKHQASPAAFVYHVFPYFVGLLTLMWTCLGHLKANAKLMKIMPKINQICPGVPHEVLLLLSRHCHWVFFQQAPLTVSLKFG